MKPIVLKYQGGVALIMFVLILMGVGGLLLLNYSQGLIKQVEVKKAEHNTRVLKEAKQALLQFAYNYPVLSTPSIGPGRLPNADTNNNGLPNFGSTFGRLPWAQANLNLYDILDADGERLWYAVSSTFRPQVTKVNSDTSGNLTLRDQQGNVIYDGSNPGGLTQYGIAAVIIAPGAVTARNGVAQDRSIANVNNPVHYLDLVFGTEDNATRTLDSPTDGFILGPVNTQSNDAVNDQFIVITAAEVAEVAEKATLQAYRSALQAYDQRIDTDVGPGDHYPWLYNYGSAAFPVNDYGGGYPELDEYPSEPVFATELARYLGRIGRVPSIFTSYFTETNGQPIESNLRVNLTLEYPTSPSTVGFNQGLGRCPSNPAINCTSGVLNFDSGDDRVFNVPSTDPLINVTFEDTNPNVFSANDGRLTATYVSNDTVSDVRYFWDEEPVGNGWRQCPFGGTLLIHCDRDDDGDPDPGNNETPSQILRIQIDVNLTGTVIFDMDYDDDPDITIVNDADGTRHANITGDFEGDDLDAGTLPVDVTYEYDAFYDLLFDNLEFGNLALADLIEDGSLELTLRYYPELPDWVFDNGWHDSVQMAYANNLQPSIAGACIEADALPANRCLTVNNLAGNIDNKKSILVIAGQHNWNDDNDPGLADDVDDVFDAENDNLDDTFDVRAAGGNDKILVIDEQP